MAQSDYSEYMKALEKKLSNNTSDENIHEEKHTSAYKPTHKKTHKSPLVCKEARHNFGCNLIRIPLIILRRGNNCRSCGYGNCRRNGFGCYAKDNP